ncbi:MAG TPA: phosphoglucosamine mutase [Vicinamibacterales bacterium]|nr:phosphoglucosamine mutase [Vicinamibacterales bacterium]
MTQALFGTDGIRGTAGVFPLDVRTVRRVGAALVKALPSSDARLLIGRDTRESGEWIERELAHGARAAGATVHSIGVAPTPAVAYLTGSLDFEAGVVISASHNPYQDNGIKVFSGAGVKYGAVEERIEQLVADASWDLPNGQAGAVTRAEHLRKYLDHARGVLPNPHSLGPVRLAVDCANGAMTSVAPALFKELGFNLTVMGAAPDGRNINKGVGSTHPEKLAEIVRRERHRLGVAFDGDGDRAILVDENGRVLDGDHVLLMCAKQMKADGRLRGNAVVATVMSNIGLEIALRKLDIELIRTQVGDKYVMEEMQRRGLSLGGEQSGHLIFSEHLFTGDGLITALNVLRTMAVSGRGLADLADDLTTYPQVLLNVRVREKTRLETIPEVAAVMKKVEEQLNGNGRLLVRYSGTETLLRVMLEGQKKEEIDRWAEDIADAVRNTIGAQP